MQKEARPRLEHNSGWEIFLMSFRMRLGLVAVLVMVMFILHNSFFLWGFDSRFPLLFGFMPFAFSYYVAYAFLALGAMKLVISFAWPDPPAGLFDDEAEGETVSK